MSTVAGNVPSSFFSAGGRGIVFALLATIVWSFNFIAGRGLIHDIPPCTLAFGRWIVAFCAILPFALPSLKRDWRHFWVNRYYYLLISLVGIAYFNTAIYIGAHSVPALNMSFIATTSPLFTLALARLFLGEPVTLIRLGGLVIVLAGILLLLARGDLGVLAALSFNKGDLLLLSAAFSFSLYTLLVRKKPGGGGQVAYFAVTFGMGALFLLPFALYELASGAVIHYTATLAVGLLYMGLGASLFSFWCWTKAINAIGPAKSAIIYYSLPFFCGIEAVFMLGEPVLPAHFVSGILIFCGLVLATKEPRKNEMASVRRA